MSEMKWKTVLGVSLALSFGAQHSLADGNLNCEAYAQLAVESQAINQKMNCGFTGGRWSDNYQGHLSWCKSAGVKMENLTTEDRARNAATQQCPAQQTPRCNAYADASVAASAKNQEIGCGLQGSRYSNNRQGHFNWCMTTPESSVNAEAGKRDQGINACVASKEEGACRFVAVATKGYFDEYNATCTGLDHPAKLTPEMDVMVYSEQEVMRSCQSKGVAASQADLDVLFANIAVCRSML